MATRPQIKISGTTPYLNHNTCLIKGHLSIFHHRKYSL